MSSLIHSQPVNPLEKPITLIISKIQKLYLAHAIKNNHVIRLFLPFHKKTDLITHAHSRINLPFQVKTENNVFNKTLYDAWLSLSPIQINPPYPLDYSVFSPSALKVINVVKAIPFGEVMTYGEVAQKAGLPRAARFVGTVMKHNPYPPFVPCHRVIAKSPKHGGYTFGKKLKHALIKKEKHGVPLNPDLFP